jgi:hypothetical protein
MHVIRAAHYDPRAAWRAIQIAWNDRPSGDAAHIVPPSVILSEMDLGVAITATGGDACVARCLRGGIHHPLSRSISRAAL